jgi:metallo-beta-lactamase family protein
MARAVLEVYRAHLHELDENVAGDVPEARGRNYRKVCAFCTEQLRVVATVPESRAVQESSDPAIIVSSSGMATGGRVLHHLVHTLPDARNTVLFVGYQAAGTRGRKMLEGAGFTRIHGADVPVKARIESLDSMSAHADANEIMRWLGGFTSAPDLTCLVHGEPEPMDALRARIEKERGWRVATPRHLETVEIP